MVQDVATALSADGRGFAVFIDEMQDVDDEHLSALIAVRRAAGQNAWPFYVVGAGLPSLPAKLAEARSYAERLFDYHEIGPLPESAAREALCDPAEKPGASYDVDAVRALVDVAMGYPYFIQEYGKAIWNLAPDKRFHLADAEAAIQVGGERLDRGFFPARWDRATPAERKYLTAMAEDGDTGSNTGVVAKRLGAKPTSLGPTRPELITKGFVHAPRDARVPLTVHFMAAFIARQPYRSSGPYSSRAPR